MSEKILIYLVVILLIIVVVILCNKNFNEKFFQENSTSESCPSDYYMYTTENGVSSCKPNWFKFW